MKAMILAPYAHLLFEDAGHGKMKHREHLIIFT